MAAQGAIRGALALIWTYRRILLSTTRAEIERKYAGSYFGLAWALIYPVCFLAMFSFLYLVVLRVRLPEFSEFGFVLYVFSGLVPYLAFSEVAGAAPVVVKQNIHLVKNVMMPIDIIPVRAVLVAMVGEAVALALLVVMLAGAGELSARFPLAIAALAVQLVFLVGLAWLLAGLGVLVPDVANVVNLLTLFLLFLSPIAFKPEMVPAHMQWVVSANPLAYLIDILRSALVAGHPLSALSWAVATALAALTFAAGLAFFRRFKAFIVDYE